MSFSVELFLFIDAMLVPIIGVVFAYLFFLHKPAEAWGLATSRAGLKIHQFWQSGWGVDRAYKAVAVKPFLLMARINRGDFIEAFYGGLAGLSIALNGILVATQSGRVRTYAAVIAGGALVLLSIIILTI